jgi:glutathione peroxidase-family protein
MAHIHDLTVASITGEPVDLGGFRGSVLLIVNVASA